jgi:hypothetical protein
MHCDNSLPHMSDDKKKLDAETAKQTLILFTKALREIEHEMLAYVAVANELKVRFHLDDAEINRMVEAARNLDEVEQQLQQKYDNRLKKMIAAIDEADLQKQLQILVAKLGSIGPIN